MTDEQGTGLRRVWPLAIALAVAPVVTGGIVYAARDVIEQGSVPLWGVLAAAGVVTGGIAAGLVGVMWRDWVQPIRGLGRVAGELARGNWLSRAADTSGGAVELRDLGQKLNAMGEKAREQLSELENQWRVVQALVDTLPDPVLLVEAHRRVTLINAAAGRLLDVPPARAVNRWLGEVVKDRALLETFDAIPATGMGEPAGDEPPVQREVVVEREGHRLVYQAVVMRTAEGVLLLLRDVTAMTETVRMKTDFVANASHELRTPIAAIKAAFETLREVYAEDPEQTERCVRIIDGHLRRLEEMLRDLLDLSRLESPEFRVEWGAVRAEELFAHVRGGLGEMASAKGVAVRMSAEGMGGAFRGDVRLLNMVLKNLVENAIKYTPGAGSVDVEVRRESEGGAVSMVVSDSGIGIPPEHIHRVFERFYQVNPARSGSAGRGTGLGLAIVKHAVGAMGGTVAIESKVGQGTTVTCVFPQPEGSLVGV